MTNRTTLLQRALAKPRIGQRDCPTNEEIELAVAFFKSDITTNQLMAAYGKNSHVTCVYSAASILRRAIAHGAIAVKATP